MSADEKPVLPANPAVDRAIAAVQATEQAGPVMQRVEMRLLGNPARPAILLLPDDITAEEGLGLIFGALQAVDAMRTKARPSPILVPRH